MRVPKLWKMSVMAAVQHHRGIFVDEEAMKLQCLSNHPHPHRDPDPFDEHKWTAVCFKLQVKKYTWNWGWMMTGKDKYPWGHITRFAGLICCGFVTVIIGGSSELPMWLTDGFLVTFFGRWRGAVCLHMSHIQLPCMLRVGVTHVWKGHSHVGVTHVWKGHSHVGVTHVWKGHSHIRVTQVWKKYSHVGVTHMWKGHSHVGGIHMWDEPPKWNSSLPDINLICCGFGKMMIVLFAAGSFVSVWGR